MFKHFCHNQSPSLMLAIFKLHFLGYLVILWKLDDILGEEGISKESPQIFWLSSFTVGPRELHFTSFQWFWSIFPVNHSLGRVDSIWWSLRPFLHTMRQWHLLHGLCVKHVAESSLLGCSETFSSSRMSLISFFLQHPVSEKGPKIPRMCWKLTEVS